MNYIHTMSVKFITSDNSKNDFISGKIQHAYNYIYMYVNTYMYLYLVINQVTIMCIMYYYT